MTLNTIFGHHRGHYSAAAFWRFAHLRVPYIHSNRFPCSGLETMLTVAAKTAHNKNEVENKGDGS
jgi:hypothetical protein